MTTFILRRIGLMIPMLFAVSLISFAIIQLPPGDFLTTLQAQTAETGGGMTAELAELLRQNYGLDRPFLAQYLNWIDGFPVGDFGYSFEWTSPVWPLIADRLGYTILLGMASLLIMFVLAIPIGIYSATHQYSLGDASLSALAFIGLSIPGFLLALIWLYVGAVVLRLPVTGVQSPEFQDAPMSIAKVVDYLAHFIPPALILGLASTAQLMRIMRSGMLDVLSQQYITTARAKGLKERKVVNKYAVRSALNPVVSVMAMEVPKIISSSILIGVVLSVPTTGPLFLRSLLSQDMFLAGTFLLMMALMQLVANLVADVALAWLDPRIVYS
ncbi:MAG: ABC transporter permease [Anaerolineaceae bacterium]|nr:ABC transporter permease [Anaerolineaceae bacterium]